MIITGLPYKLEEMSEIANNGAIVDMSNIKFPNTPEDKQIRTAFIFLRNTGFSVTLDFSNCQAKKKEQILKEYIVSDICFNSIDLTNMWLQSIKQDVENNDLSDVTLEALQLLASLPVYALYRHKLKDVSYTMDDLEIKVLSHIGSNYINLLKNPNIAEVVIDSFSLIDIPVFFSNIFTDDNNELMQILANSNVGICQILNMVCTLQPDEFEKQLSLINDAYESIILN